jgi:hypothetical protein
LPVWMPILISTLNPVASRINLKKKTRNTDNLVDSLEDTHLTEIRTEVLQVRLPARWQTAKSKLHVSLSPPKHSGNYMYLTLACDYIQ